MIQDEVRFLPSDIVDKAHILDQRFYIDIQRSSITWILISMCPPALAAILSLALIYLTKFYEPLITLKSSYPRDYYILNLLTFFSLVFSSFFIGFDQDLGPHDWGGIKWHVSWGLVTSVLLMLIPTSYALSRRKRIELSFYRLHGYNYVGPLGQDL